MPIVPLLIIKQRTEDGVISIDTQVPNPLLVVDLLLTAAKSYVAQADKVMEPKNEAMLVTGEQSKILIT